MLPRRFVIAGILVLLVGVISSAGFYYVQNKSAYRAQSFSDYSECLQGKSANEECCYSYSQYQRLPRCTLNGVAVDMSALGTSPSGNYGTEGKSCGFLDAYPCCASSAMMKVEGPNDSMGFASCQYQYSGYSSALKCIKGSSELNPYGGGGAGDNGICLSECQASFAGVPGATPKCKYADGTPLTNYPSPGLGERCKLEQMPCCPTAQGPTIIAGGGGPNMLTCQNYYICDLITNRCKDPNGMCGNGERESAEMCDLGTGNFFTGDSYSSQEYTVPPQNLRANCTGMCMQRCANGTCDAYECSTDTDPQSLYCSSDCSTYGQCGDGCDNDTDQFRNLKDPGCYIWDPVYVKGGGKDPHPTQRTIGGDESQDCPQPVSIPFEGPVGHEASRANSSNMCKPVFNYGLCSPPGGPGTQSSEPYAGNGDVVLWPSIETCCREQANWVVTYFCDNSHDPAKSKEMSWNRKMNPLCGEDVKEAIREEFVAICACENGGLTTTGSPKVKAIEILRTCAEQQCPDECRNGGANWKECGACMGAGGSEYFDGTKANACRTQAILACGTPAGSSASAISSSAVSTSVSSTSSSSSSSSIRCGNTIVEAGEACDAGPANIPSDVANLPMNVIYLIRNNGSASHEGKTYNNTHLALLKGSSCMSDCTIAQCSDTTDNEPDTRNNQNDVGCHFPVVQTTVGAPYDCTTLTTDYLPGRNSELDLCQENPTSSSTSRSSSSSSSRSTVHESSRSTHSASSTATSTPRSSSVISSTTSFQSTASQRSGISSSSGPPSTSRSSTTSTLNSSSVTVGSSTSRSSSSHTSSVLQNSSSSRNTVQSSASNRSTAQESSRSGGISTGSLGSASSSFSIKILVIREILPACGGDECSLGGTRFCGLTDQTCQQVSDLPCIRCMGGASSEDSLRCSGEECTMGGSAFCSLTGQTCINDAATEQCFRCVSASSASARQEFSSSIQPSSRPIIEIAHLPTFCGNGITESGEQCDNGNDNGNNPNACRTNCTLSRCGDGIIDIPLEACDDGNMRSNDGCSHTCQLERTATETLPAQVIELPQQRIQQPTPVDVAYQQPSFAEATNRRTDTIVQHAAPPSHPDTGPAALAVMISGAAAGYAWMKRRVGK